MDKTCTKCSIIKHIAEFSKNKGCKDGHSHRCKSCISEYKKLYREKNKTKIAADLSVYRAKNKEKAAKYAKQWYETNKDKTTKQKREYYAANSKSICARTSAWKVANPESGKASAVRFKAKQLRATPLWVSTDADELWLIEQFYARARELTKLTGVAYEVDHIIPLNGINVCGFHCAENLQVLTAKENRQKGNR